MPHIRHVHYKVSAFEEIFKKAFACNIIGRRHQEIYLKLEEKIGRKSWKKKLEESTLGQKLEENIL